MSQFRRQLLFLCDAFLFAVAVAGYKFITVLLPYTEVGSKGSFPKNVLLLYGCTVIAQLLFRTYDSLWRYAESREYLALLCAAICGFGAYEIFSRALLHESISFVLLAAIASLWVLEMLAVRFGYRMYRTVSIQREQPGAVPVAIIGAGSAGVQQASVWTWPTSCLTNLLKKCVPPSSGSARISSFWAKCGRTPPPSSASTSAAPTCWARASTA